MSHNYTRLFKIASSVREWAERQLNCTRESRFYFSKNLDGMCAIASGRLFTKLKNNNFSSVIIIGRCHCHVRCNGYIVDVTATQFSSLFDPVIVEKSDIFNARLVRVKEDTGVCFKSTWEELARFEDVKSFRQRLLENNWPMYQLPS